MDSTTFRIDLSVFPSIFDVLHVGLAGLSALLLIALALVAAMKNSRQAQAMAEPVRQPPPAPVVIKEAGPDAALQLLGLLQSEARLIDFLEENIGGYSDADIGAAVRVVHEGCRKVLKSHVQLEPIRNEAEGDRVTLPRGFDASAVRLTGNIVGEAPFSGTLVHRGWRATGVTLPKMAEGHDLKIVAPAEVEL